MANEMTFTYQTRLGLNTGQDAILQECANCLNHVERSLYAEVAKGKTSASCKNSFLKAFGITARQFNACRVVLEGKISACKASLCQAIASLKEQIAALEKKIRILGKKPSKSPILHQKKRRKEILLNRLSSLEEDQKHGRTRICFGGKKLFYSQFYLKSNGFSSHEEWKKAWEAKRNSEFFVLGSKDETAGNQTCTAIVKKEGLTLRLRLPIALEEKFGKYLEIEKVSFTYGQEAILASLNQRQAISYRFKKDAKSWTLFVSTKLKKQEILSQENLGAIGIDLNADHVAYVETDRFGNPILKQTLPLVSYGKSKNSLKALIGDVCKKIIEKAVQSKKPLVIENLDFQKKKASLRETRTGVHRRILSSFAYGLFFSHLIARAYKHGVTIHSVNPAYTSIIGTVNYAKRYGLNSHLAAALCIARRYLQFSESPISPQGIIPDGKGSHITFDLPARNRTKHVWHFWDQAKKKIKTVLAAHFRAIKNRSLSPFSAHETEIPIVIGAIPIREPLAKLLG